MRFGLRVATILTALGATVLPVMADEALTPLREVIRQEASAETLIYALRRCSGLMMEVSLRNERTRGTQDPLSTKTYKLTEDFLTAAMIIDGQVRSDAGSSIDMSRLALINSNASDEIRYIYSDIMDAEYSRTGRSLDKISLEDMKFCSEMRSKLAVFTHID